MEAVRKIVVIVMGWLLFLAALFVTFMQGGGDRVRILPWWAVGAMIAVAAFLVSIGTDLDTP